MSGRENLDEFIQRKREILSVKKSTEYKKKNIEYLDSVISEKEKTHKETMKQIEDHYSRVEKYEDSLMVEAKKKAELAENKAKERSDLYLECMHITEDIEIMQVQYERKLEEFKHLEDLKLFVEEIASQRIRNTEETSMFITQGELLCKAPEQILESIDSLESNNLFRVRQVQETEAEIDLLKSNNFAIEQKISEKNEELLVGIRSLEKQKEGLMAKIKNYSKEEVEALIVDENTLEEIYGKLEEILKVIGVDTRDHLPALVMLEIIENSLQENIRKKDLMDEDVVKKRERDIDRNRRTEMIENIKENEIKKRLEAAEALQKRKSTIKEKRNGRPMMKRSKITEKTILTETSEIPQEVLDRIEFLDEKVNINS